MRKNLLLIFRIIVSAAILFVLFKYIDYRRLIETYLNSKKIYLLFGFFALFLANLIGVFRWKFLLFSLGKKISFKETLSAFFSGLFFNILFPSFIAGDIFRGATISYRHGDAKKIASSVLMDRFSGAIGLILISTLAFIFGASGVPKRQIVIPLLMLCLVASFIFLVIGSRRFFSFLVKILGRKSLLRKRLIEFHDQLYFFRQKPKIFAQSLLYSLVIQFLTVFSFFVVSRGFGLELGIIYFLIFVPIAMAIVFIPVAIAGFGTREWAMVYLFSLVGVDKNIAASMSFLNGIFIILFNLLGGIFYVTVYHRWIQSRPSRTSNH